MTYGYMSAGSGCHSAKPFLKWAGGKGQLLDRLSLLIPAEFNDYFEPFLGGGAMFFYLTNHNLIQNSAFLSDTNADLMNVYKCLKTNPDLLLSKLLNHKENYMKDRAPYYYTLRRTHYYDDFERAAQFVTLNKTCYNGLYRVNRTGMFNVPIGRFKKPLICDATNLKYVSSVLNLIDVKIECTSYSNILQWASEGDFVYLDPPFSPISRTSNFTEYTAEGFGAEDQKHLATLFRSLSERKCKVVLSNSDTDLVRNLYRKFEIMTVPTRRSINCKSGGRRGNTELIITN
jgi:DNA adenine methylase